MSLTSTATTDARSTLLTSPSQSREQKKGHTQLRRRMHSLGIPSLRSLSGSASPAGAVASKDTTEMSLDEESPTHTDDRHFAEFESFAASEGETDPDGLHIGASPKPDSTNGSPKRERDMYIPKINTSQSYEASSPDGMSPNSRSWYEFDLSVVVALVSPIGNWLTGGDHVKSLLMILLLIFYLHQIIEIPWALYHKSRPRRRFQPHEAPTDPHSICAASELRLLEMFFLALTVASPILGAVFLRYVIIHVSGRDALSWFSTVLFVLATGIRPWRHLVERLNERTKHLHDAIHYPPAPLGLESKLDGVLDRIAHLESSLASTRTKLVHATDELYEYVDDAVDTVEIACRKTEKKFEKHDARMKDVEDVLAALKKSKDFEKKLSIKTPHGGPHPSSVLLSLLPSWLGPGVVSPPRTPTRVRPPPVTIKHGLRAYPSNSSIRLESIPEEDTKPPPVSLSSSFQLHIPGAPLVLRWGDLATLPLRRVAHYLLT